MNYYNAFIRLASDSAATHSAVPPARGEKRTIPVIEYELLAAKPYFYTQEELQFAVHVEREGIAPAQLKAKRRELWAEFFNKPRACLRCSSLPKKYGWGLHFDEQGRIGLVPVESAAYKKFSGSKTLKVVPAMSSKRA
ncbi:DUF6157 family protein [Lacipirellula parvula]|uniref:Uncharacterized protein n=1 Tax=Lacipirellula parvula TaxID=2650471 RepID=A0A5K7XFR5_9BACT|nr:DUF6157 family protein [Lacipirellula parvula]BBO33186.1 hypothetical protein PLANPX_2798 [Lacipirellula parvula]